MSDIGKMVKRYTSRYAKPANMEIGMLTGKLKW